MADGVRTAVRLDNKSRSEQVGKSDESDVSEERIEK